MSNGTVIENPDKGFKEVVIPNSFEKATQNLIDLDSLLHDDHKDTGLQTALLILNQPIEHSFETFQRLWESSRLVVCADGGGNRLFDYVRHLVLQGIISNSEEDHYVPKYIVGDLDSLRDNVKQYYISKGTLVKRQESQYATDFNKCVSVIELDFKSKALGKSEADLRKVVEDANTYDGLITLFEQISGEWKNSNVPRNDTLIKCLGGIGGRFDHTVQTISILHKYYLSNPHLHFVFINKQDVIIFVPTGDNYIKFTNDVNNNCDCGLLPLYGEIVLHTEGLKWDVREWNSSISASVSSSNRIIDPRCFRIKSTGPLVINIVTSL